jgi:hypothetical protein
MIETPPVQQHSFSLRFIKRKKTALDLIVSRKAAVAAAVGAETGDIQGSIYLRSSAETHYGNIRRAQVSRTQTTLDILIRA